MEVSVEVKRKKLKLKILQDNKTATFKYKGIKGAIELYFGEDMNDLEFSLGSGDTFFKRVMGVDKSMKDLTMLTKEWVQNVIDLFLIEIQIAIEKNCDDDFTFEKTFPHSITTGEEIFSLMQIKCMCGNKYVEIYEVSTCSVEDKPDTKTEMFKIICPLCGQEKILTKESDAKCE